MVFRAIALPQEVLVGLPQLGMGVTLLGHNVTLRDDIFIILPPRDPDERRRRVDLPPTGVRDNTSENPAKAPSCRRRSRA